jgi:exosome complex component RRP4
MAVYFQKRELVVPGQLLAEGRYRPSIGTYDEDGKIFSALVGLAELRGNTVKVVPLEGVYIPREGDLVIGKIIAVMGNNWKIDIKGPYIASLHANNALRRPYDDDISRYMDISDVVVAEVIAFDRVSGPFLTMKGRGLRRLEGGMILDVSPAKIPRIIGRRGSMINMIKEKLRLQTMVGQNGRIWIRAPDIPTLRLAIKAFKMVEAQAHTSKLTDRVKVMLDEEVAVLKEKKEEMSPMKEETVSEEEPEEAPESEVDAESKETEVEEKETEIEEAPTKEPKTPEKDEDEAEPESAKKDEKEESDDKEVKEE